MKSIMPLLLMISLIVSSCSRETQDIARQTASNFQCSNLYDGVFIGVENQGDMQIAFSADSNKMAVDALTKLKEKVASGCGAKGGERNQVFLVGYFTGSKSKAVTKHNAPESAKPIFCLLGWYIQTPFFEQIEVPEGAAVPPPKVRSDLHVTDFAPPIDPKLIHHDQKRGLFWLGTEPPATLPRPAK